MKNLQELYIKITKDRGEPLDIWEVAALLEVYGIRDIDAKQEYGYEDVFALAKALMKYRDTLEYPKLRLIQKEELPPFKERVVKNFLKGLAFAMPMLLQSFATIFFGFALWSNLHMGVMEATIVALSTFLAMILTGGPAQIIGRKGLYYLKMNETILAAKTIELLFLVSVAKLFFITLFFFLANSIFGVLEGYLFVLFLTIFVLLSLLFLSTSIYYVFEEYEKILLFFIFGLMLVFSIHYLFGLDYLKSQFIALSILDGTIIFFAFKKLKKLREETKSEGEILPRASMMVYTLIPFFVYGFFYFIFLVQDRLIAWNANANFRGGFLWFDAKYEVGSDLALLIFIILMGLVEVVVYELLYNLNDKIFEFDLHNYEKFNRNFVNFYSKVNKIFIISSIVSIIVVYLGVMILTWFVDDSRLPFSGYGHVVFFIGAIAFAFLASGLMNALILFSFSRQKVVVKAVFAAVLANFVVGIIASRMIEYYFAVFGLLAGSIVFWYMTYSFISKMFKKLDYYYYSAY